MRVAEGQQKFIDTWGSLSSSWGISKSMAQMHALLLISPSPMCANQIQDKLDVSIGNVNANLHALMDWNLIFQTPRQERKVHYRAEKDIWKVFTSILQERKKRELEPLIKILDDLVSVEANCQQSTEFCKVVREIKQFASSTDSALENLLSSESNWIVDSWMHLIK